MHLDPARIIIGQYRLLIDLSLVVTSAYHGVIWLLYMVARHMRVVVELHTVWLGNVTFGRRHNGGWRCLIHIAVHCKAILCNKIFVLNYDSACLHLI